MTIDVEDYYHVAAFGHVIEPATWGDWPSRVEANTDRLLELFERRQLKCTFFVLGWVAERFPALIRRIAAGGHEIASHGFSHQLVYRQSPETFREETRRSKRLLEDLVQQPVVGYRAASYSITRQSLWALDILADLGFEWDSSIFPIRHDNYGVPDSPRSPYIIALKSGRCLVEFPLTTARVWGLSVPAAGGGYFRQYPYALSRWLFERASEGQTKPLLFYLHPWEIDPDQPRVPGAGWKSRFRHYTNLHRCLPRLERLLNDFEFSSMGDSLGSIDISERIDFGV